MPKRPSFLSFSSATPQEAGDDIRPLVPVQMAEQSTQYAQKITGKMMTDLMEMSPEVQNIVQKANTPEGLEELRNIPTTKMFAITKAEQLEESRLGPVIIAVQLENGQYAILPNMTLNYQNKQLAAALKHFGVDPKHLATRHGQIKIGSVKKPAFGDIRDGQLFMSSEGSISI